MVYSWRRGTRCPLPRTVPFSFPLPQFESEPVHTYLLPGPKNPTLSETIIPSPSKPGQSCQNYNCTRSKFKTAGHNSGQRPTNGQAWPYYLSAIAATLLFASREYLLNLLAQKGFICVDSMAPQPLQLFEWLSVCWREDRALQCMRRSTR